MDKTVDSVDSEDVKTAATVSTAEFAKLTTEADDSSGRACSTSTKLAYQSTM